MLWENTGVQRVHPKGELEPGVMLQVIGQQRRADVHFPRLVLVVGAEPGLAPIPEDPPAIQLPPPRVDAKVGRRFAVDPERPGLATDGSGRGHEPAHGEIPGRRVGSNPSGSRARPAAFPVNPADGAGRSDRPPSSCCPAELGPPRFPWDPAYGAALGRRRTPPRSPRTA